ncbi:MAG TPA: class I SAM-dependent methyltransferase [Ktedonobacterales bacterium]|jgi:SAM-dependent methyltransferase
MPADPYAALAEWYDLEHDAIIEDIEFFAQQIAGLGVARLRILEIGSGTGRIAAGLALAGCEVVGVEPSAAMRARGLARLSALPERVARRMTVLDGDARLLTLPPDARFDAALYGLDTFAHLLTAGERNMALRAAYERLRPGGKLLIDLDPLGPRRLAESIGRDWLQGEWQDQRSGRVLRHTLRATDMSGGVVTIQNMLTVTAPDGVITETTTELRLALLSREEVERAISAAGFTLEAISGSYGGLEVASDSPRLIFVAAR